MIGIQIATLRRDAGMTQEELARHIHVSASAIGMYEQGRRLPAAPILVALAQVFNVTIGYLVTSVPCAAKDPASSNSSLEKICQHSDPECEALNMLVLREIIAYLHKVGVSSSMCNVATGNSSSGGGNNVVILERNMRNKTELHSSDGFNAP